MIYLNKLKNKNLIVMGLIIIEIFFLFLTYKSFNNKTIELTNNYENKNKNFQMFIENKNTGKYEEIFKKTYPINYLLNKNLSSCRDINGDVIDINYSYTNGNMQITSNKTIYCTFYFDVFNSLYEEFINSSWVTEYRGEGYYHDENDKDEDNPYFTRPIYYWNSEKYYSALVNKTNVLYANSCWQIVRTTENGGVKLLYMGAPILGEQDGKTTYCCNCSRSYAETLDTGYNVVNLYDTNYYYGTSYIFDAGTGYFKLINESSKTMTRANYKDFVGLYTCRSTTANSNCNKIYLIKDAFGTNFYGYTYDIIVMDKLSTNNRVNNNLDTISYASGGLGVGVFDIYNSNDPGYKNSGTDDKLKITITKSQYSSLNGTYSNEYYYNENTGSYSISNGTYSSNIDSSLVIGNYFQPNNVVNNYTIYSYFESNESGYTNSVLAVPPFPITSTSFNIGTTITDNYDGTYTIGNINEYSVKDWTTVYSIINTNSNKYYMCSDNSSTCLYENMRRIKTVSSSVINFELINSNYSSYGSYRLSTSVIDNGNQTYTMVDSTSIPAIEWDYDESKYVCLSNETICPESNLRYGRNDTPLNIVNFSDTINYDDNTNKYTLDMTSQNAIKVWNLNNMTEFAKIGSARYFCLDYISTNYYQISFNNLECENVGYVLYKFVDETLYLPLSNGEYFSIDTTNSLTFNNEKNVVYKKFYMQSDSYARPYLENLYEWYEFKLLGRSYEDVIDREEVYCRDRTISDWGNLDPSSDVTVQTATYFGRGNNKNLNCVNIEDSFSNVLTTKGNGRQQYPVEVLSYPEYYLDSNFIKYLSSSNSYTMTPRYFNAKNGANYNYEPFNYTCLNCGASGTVSHIRPVIALKSDTNYIRGSGTKTDPYIIDAGTYSIINNTEDIITPTKELPGNLVTLTSNLYSITSFKLNGNLISGNSFIMPYENAYITDLEYTKVGYNIHNSIKDIIVPSTSLPGETITLDSNKYKIYSFKLNNELIEGNSFTMPNEDAYITEINKKEKVVVELEEHNPYPNIRGTKTYYENTFNNATSLSVTLTYETYGSSTTFYESLQIYQKVNNNITLFGTYNGNLQTVNLIIPGNYIKINWNSKIGTNDSYSYTISKYGFKAEIVPNYE